MNINPFQLTSTELINLIEYFKLQGLKSEILLSDQIQRYEAIKAIHDCFYISDKTNHHDIEEVVYQHKRLFAYESECDWMGKGESCTKNCLWNRFAYGGINRDCFDSSIKEAYWSALDKNEFDSLLAPCFVCPIVLLKLILLPTYCYDNLSGDVNHSTRSFKTTPINKNLINYIIELKAKGRYEDVSKDDINLIIGNRIFNLYKMMLPTYSEEMLKELLPTSWNGGINMFLVHYFRYIFYQFNKLMKINSYEKKN